MSTRSCTPAVESIDQQYGRLLVQRIERRGGRTYGICLCECGENKVVLLSHVRCGDTRSCGCLQREVAKAATAARNTTHGATRTPTFVVWKNMLSRCANPNATEFALYGGRGITVCERWRNSFAAFLADVGERPGRDCSIDRIDNSGNYEPANCRWATRTEQGRNRRTNHVLTHDGRTQPLVAWAEECGISHATIRHRLNRGWSVERALTTKAVRTRGVLVSMAPGE